MSVGEAVMLATCPMYQGFSSLTFMKLMRTGMPGTKFAKKKCMHTHEEQ